MINVVYNKIFHRRASYSTNTVIYFYDINRANNYKSYKIVYSVIILEKAY